MTALNPPHGGTLVNLLVDDARALELRQQAKDWPSWDLTPRQLFDLELLPDGDGIDHVRNVAERHPTLPIIVLSAPVAAYLWVTI